MKNRGKEGTPRKTLGLALGGGSARGLSHIGILKVLHQHTLFPNYLAGTSMGAVIAALYAAGYTPEQIQSLAKTTDWKTIVDFTVPKAGLIRGQLVENKLRQLLQNKTFAELAIPLRLVAYNLTKKQQVVFSQGDVAKAVRASISIPGIFTPVRMGSDQYVDGSISNPTPFDVVQSMGAAVVVAVDLFKQEKPSLLQKARRDGLFSDLQEQFILAEFLNVENYLFPKRWPHFFRRIGTWGFEKLLSPARFVKRIMGKELPDIAKVMNRSIGCLMNNLAKERLQHADIALKITPSFGKLHWGDFDEVDAFVAIGEEAMRKEMGKLRGLLQESA